VDETAVERLLKQSVEDPRDAAGPFSERARQTARSVESYLKAGVRPRWMERIAEIERGIRREKAELERSYAALRGACGDDRRLFAQRWRALAAERDFDDLNTLIRQHNDWYPIERDLPMDPRTGEYVKIIGRSHRRPQLDAQWILDRFPA
jgi:hypothetical protein